MNISNFKLKSHPNRLLKDHLIEVTNLFEKIFDDLGINDNNLKVAIKIACFFHDIGKSTQYFQDYLLSNNRKKTDLNQHAFIGALAGYIIADKYFGDNELYKIIPYLIAKRHHGNIDTIIDEFDLNGNNNKLNNLEKQINSIDINEIVEIINFFKNEINIDFDIQEIIDFFKNENEKFMKSRSFIRRSNKQNLDFYINILISFSLLLDSDKSETVIENTDILFKYKEYNLIKDIIFNYTNNLQNNNQIRNKALYYINNYEIDLNKKIYSITLPTQQ